MTTIAFATTSPLLTGDDILKPIAKVEGTEEKGTEEKGTEGPEEKGTEEKGPEEKGTEEKGTEEKEKKEKKENLPAKFFKSMVFGYWNLLRLKEDSIITEDVYSQALGDYLKPFASVADQTSLYESFDTDFKMLSKDLKKMIKDHHKPPKAKKVPKEKKAKEKKTNPPCPKGSVNQKDLDLVSRIIDAALTSTETSVPCKPKRKYNRKKSIPEVQDGAGAVQEKVDYCIGCESGLDNDDGHRDPKTNNYYANCSCAPVYEDTFKLAADTTEEVVLIQ